MLKHGRTKRSRGDPNEVVIKGDYAEVITYDINYDEKGRFLIDTEDIDKIIHLKWSIRNDGYVSAKSDGVGVKLHRLIANTPDGMHTDHINLDKLDNRKENLRIVTQAKNNKNKGFYSNNTSGYKGVYWLRNRWHAQLTYKNKKYHLGCFKNKEDAIEARRLGELKYRANHTQNTPQESS